MTTILLRRGTGIPTGLQTGEPAVDVGAHRLFIGGGAAEGYPLGCQSLPYPRRTNTPKVIGDVSANALSTATQTSQRLYFIPYVVPRRVMLTGLRISVTTSATGTASIGIYANTIVGDNDRPGSLLASADNLDTSTTGDKTGSVSLTLLPGVLYWACVICSAAATLRALHITSTQSVLGRQVNTNNAYTHLYADGSGATLPDPAPTPLSSGTGLVPCIYLLE